MNTSSINEIISRYNELNNNISSLGVINNPEKLKEYSIELKSIEEAYGIATKIKSLLQEIEDDIELINNETDSELKLFYQEELNRNKEQLAILEQKFHEKTFLADPNDLREIIIELRAGTGGEEASLFASDLYRMYVKYAESKGWNVQTISVNYSENGGFKEIVFGIDSNIYGKMKLESGVHRVQRIPATESSGRIHTSAVSVVVLPKAKDIEVDIKEEEIRVDVYRASGPGGQSVNTTDSAVRIFHIPSGITVTCQDEKSQLKNKKKALSVLQSRLLDIELQKKADSEKKTRLSAISGGDRSAKIRTYNYPQNRVTDHRIKKSWHNLNEIMEGNLEEIIESIQTELHEQKLENS